MDILNKKNILPLIDQAIVSGGNALIQVVMLRLFGLNEYGVYAFLMIFVFGLLSMNQALVILPFQVLYTKGVYGDDSKINKVQLQLLLFLVGVFVFLGGVNNKLNLIDQNYILPISIYSLTILLNDFVRKKMYVLEQYKRVVLHDSLILALHFIVFVTVYVFGLNLLQYLYLAGVVLIFVEMLFFGFNGLLGVELNVYREHWLFSKWLIASTFVQWFSGNILLTTAGYVMGAWVLGVVKIGQTINGVVGVMFQLMEAYFPSKVAIQYHENGVEGMGSFLKNIGVKSFTITTIIAVLLVAVKEPFIKIVYGIDLVQYSFIIYWFASLLLVNVLNILLRFYIRTLNKNRLIFESYLILLLFSTLSSSWLVITWGLNGIGFGLLFGQVLTCLWFYIRLNFDVEILVRCISKFFVSFKSCVYEK